MTSNDLLITLVSLLLGGGGLATIQAIFRGFSSLRGGARALEREAFADVAERAEWAEADRDFWRDTAGRWLYQLRANGIDPVPPDPVPPSARRGHTRPSKPRGDTTT